MLIVENDPAKVEVDLTEGRAACPGCGGVLARWSFARRPLRAHAVRPNTRCAHGAPAAGSARRPRCCCLTCCCAGGWTQWQLIGRALTAAAGGAGCRRAAVLVGRPLTTVRGWLRRARAVAAQLAVHFTVWAHRLDANLGPIAPSGSALADALAAIGAAARAASLRLGPRPAWSWASALSGGMLLSNTSSPWKGA